MFCHERFHIGVVVTVLLELSMSTVARATDNDDGLKARDFMEDVNKVKISSYHKAKLDKLVQRVS